MIYLSASSIKDFISCERKYWYRRFASDKAKKTEEAARGTAVHKALEKFPNDTTKALAYIDSFPETAFDKSFARADVFTFFNKFYGLATKKDKIEQKFKIPYNSYGITDVSIIGMFDRVTPNGIIFDWKTGRSLPKNLNNDPQFMLYYHAYSKMYKRPPAAVYYASLHTGRLLKFEYNERLFNILYYEIIPDMLQNIRLDRFKPTGLYRYTTCKYCFFKTHCHKFLGLEDKDELDSTEFNFK